jgi:hypothetical protein
MTDYSDCTKEQLEAELATWDGVNKHISKAVRAELTSRGDSKPAKKPAAAEEELLSEEELMALKKHEQVELLRKLGAESIPRFEKDRVALLLEKKAKK